MCMAGNVKRLCEVANFVTVNFRLPINFNAKRERDFTTKFRNLAKRLLAVVLFIYKQKTNKYENSKNIIRRWNK